MTSVSVISSSEDPRRVKSQVDADGNPTDDPDRVVGGELVEYDPESKRTRRTWFRLEQVEIRWLPVSEPAFRLCGLVAVLAVWLAIGVALGLV